MRTILNIHLLIIVLCLTGCQEDQSVSFSIKAHETNCIGEIITVNVNANCPWNIFESSQQILIEQMNGDGSTALRINIAANLGYDELTHTITITSEDGTSSDILVITQKEKKGLQAENIDMISEEGGTFTIPIKTNDEIISVDTPSWISFTASRTLTNYTYTFTAKPNETRAVRNGIITLKGKELSKSIEISQDSYAPTSVSLQHDFSNVTEASFETKVFFEPEYADLSKLDILSSDGCTASIENGYLKITLDNYGVYDLTLSAQKNILSKSTIGYLPEYIISPKYPDPHYVGEKVPIEDFFLNSQFKLSTSDKSLAVISEDGNLDFTGSGYVFIEASIWGTNIYKKQLLVVNRFAYAVWMSSYLSWGSMWQVEISAVFRGKDIGNYTFAITDENKSLILPFGKQEGVANGNKTRITYQHSFGMYANNLQDLKSKIQNCKLHYNIESNGENVIGSVHVSPDRPKQIP